MSDSDSTSVGLVKSSYDDVNTALENLLGNVASNNNANVVTTDALNKALANYATLSQLSTTAGNAPVGTVYAYVTNNLPNGYLLCNGATFSQSNFPNLYSALGSATLPDMRGMFLRGLDTTGAADRDGKTRAILSFQEGTRQFADSAGEYACIFPINCQDGSATMSNLGRDPLANSSEVHEVNSIPPYSRVTFSATQSNNLDGQGGSGPWDAISISRPKNIAVNYIIKAS